MSLGSNPDPFQQMAGARPKQPSMVPKILAVVAALFLFGICGVGALAIKKIGGGLALGLHGTKEAAKEVADVELWNHYNEDEEEATKLFKDRWVVVTGECSEISSFRPDGSAINEEYAIQVGRRDRGRMGEEWLIDCNIPRQNVDAFNQRVKPNGTVSIRGKVKGRISGSGSGTQVSLRECELVKFSIK